MTPNPLHYRLAGLCALAAAGCAIAGAAVSVSFGLGGQNLPVGTHGELEQLAASRGPYLVREWLYLSVAVFALGEGIGLSLLLRASPLAFWALIAWIVGLTIGIVEDCAVVALIRHMPEDYSQAPVDLQEAILFAAGLTFDTIKVQQFVSVLLCGTVACSLFSIIGYRQRSIPLWLCLVGVLSGLTTGGFVFCNVAPGFDRIQPLLENGYSLMVVWDISVGVLLFSAGNRRSTGASSGSV